MKTISQAVSEYIKSKPFLSSALNDGIINLTSLSRQIKPEVEEILRKMHFQLFIMHGKSPDLRHRTLKKKKFFFQSIIKVTLAVRRDLMHQSYPYFEFSAA